MKLVTNVTTSNPQERLGARPFLARLRSRAWADMLGFGGHFSTKSRRYSTTLGALRRARVTYTVRRRRLILDVLKPTYSRRVRA
jgi:hypothetical protein